MMMGEALKEVEIHLLLMSHIFRDNQRPQCHIDSISDDFLIYHFKADKSFSVPNTDNIYVLLVISVGPHFRALLDFEDTGAQPRVLL